MSFQNVAADTKRYQTGSNLRSCFETCRSLINGELAFPLTRLDPLFEEQSISQFFTNTDTCFTSPSEWIEQAIDTLGQAVRSKDDVNRPIHLPMPISVLLDEDASFSAYHACNSIGFCPQEFMLEFKDASFVQAGNTALDRLEEFRRYGFRIALDARTSFETPLSERLRSAIERLRVNGDDIKFDKTTQMRAEIVSQLGGDVILDRALWRDLDELRSRGATHCESLICDA